MAAVRAIIDLDAYAHNLAYIRSIIPSKCELLPVVKANAYGHGAVRIAQRAEREGASIVGVANVEEGIALRDAGIAIPILVMTQPLPNALPDAVRHRLSITVSELALAEQLGEVAHKVNTVVPIHCKVDTGMGRQGIPLDEAEAVLQSVTRIPNIDLRGISSHFPSADTVNDAFTLNQIRNFQRLVRHAERMGIPYETLHMANSAAIVNYPTATFSMVRPGLMSYGVWPTESPPAPLPIKPVLRWEADIVLIREFEPDAVIGYGRTYTTTKRLRAAVVPVGYADGYRVALSNRSHVLVHGKRCPIRGAVSMDMIMVDITDAPHTVVGDTAVLMGQDGNETISARELSYMADTIAYEILTGIGGRVERVYREA